MKTERIIIVGAGLVGALFSVYLSKRGYTVDIFDTHPDIRRMPVRPGKAINLTLCERGLRALDRVGAGDMVRELAVPAYGRYIHPENGELVYQPYGNNQEAIYSILRRQLAEVFITFAERHPRINLHFNEKCVGLGLSPLGVEFLNTQTGATSRHDADLVFGADGTYSSVRTLMQRMHRFNYSQEFLDQGFKELELPAGSGAPWASEQNGLHMWPRGAFMLIGFPNADGSFTCALNMPFEGEPSFDSLTTPQKVEEFFAEVFPDVAPHIPHLGESFFLHPPNPMVTVRCSPWTFQGKVALIGDAAHVLFPYYGQGANAGFEDCSVLVDCLDRHGEDWPAVFADYERSRKPNMDAISQMVSHHYAEIRDQLADPRFLLLKAVERKVNQMYPDDYQPLYSMITFTTMPYAEALRIDREQRELMDKLMHIEGLERKLESRETEATIRRLMGEFIAARERTAPAPSVAPTAFGGSYQYSPEY